LKNWIINPINTEIKVENRRINFENGRLNVCKPQNYAQTSASASMKN
jgi:hypothetical protein